MRVYIGPSLDHDIMNQPGMVGLAMWIGSDAIGVEEQMAMLIGTDHPADTWKVDDWMDTTGKDYGEERSGTSNLVDALDTITWWATYSFFHLDENPVRNAYL